MYEYMNIDSQYSMEEQDRERKRVIDVGACLITGLREAWIMRMHTECVLIIHSVLMMRQVKDIKYNDGSRRP